MTCMGNSAGVKHDMHGMRVGGPLAVHALLIPGNPEKYHAVALSCNSATKQALNVPAGHLDSSSKNLRPRIRQRSPPSQCAERSMCSCLWASSQMHDARTATPRPPFAGSYSRTYSTVVAIDASVIFVRRIVFANEFNCGGRRSVSHGVSGASWIYQGLDTPANLHSAEHSTNQLPSRPLYQGGNINDLQSRTHNRNIDEQSPITNTQVWSGLHAYWSLHPTNNTSAFQSSTFCNRNPSPPSTTMSIKMYGNLTGNQLLSGEGRLLLPPGLKSKVVIYCAANQISAHAMPRDATELIEFIRFMGWGDATKDPSLIGALATKLLAFVRNNVNSDKLRPGLVEVQDTQTNVWTATWKNFTLAWAQEDGFVWGKTMSELEVESMDAVLKTDRPREERPYIAPAALVRQTVDFVEAAEFEDVVGGNESVGQTDEGYEEMEEVQQSVLQQQLAKELATKAAEAKQLERQRFEAERVANEAAEAQRLQAERVANEAAEAQRLQAERVANEAAQAQRVEDQRRQAQQVEAQRLANERQAQELAAHTAEVAEKAKRIQEMQSYILALEDRITAAQAYKSTRKASKKSSLPVVEVLRAPTPAAEPQSNRLVPSPAVQSKKVSNKESKNAFKNVTFGQDNTFQTKLADSTNKVNYDSILSQLAARHVAAPASLPAQQAKPITLSPSYEAILADIEARNTHPALTRPPKENKQAAPPAPTFQASTPTPAPYEAMLAKVLAGTQLGATPKSTVATAGLRRSSRVAANSAAAGGKM